MSEAGRPGRMEGRWNGNIISLPVHVVRSRDANAARLHDGGFAHAILTSVCDQARSVRTADPVRLYRPHDIHIACAQTLAHSVLAMRCALLSIAFTAVLALHAVVAAHSEDAHRAYMQSAGTSHNWYSVCAAPSAGVSGYQLASGIGCYSLPNTQLVAQGWYDEDIAETGWGNLYIETVTSEVGFAQAQAAGWLEGALTAERIYQQVTNWWINNFNSSIDPKVLQFIEQQDAWMRTEIHAAGGQDPYWTAVENAQLQVAGMYAGYQASSWFLSNPTLPNVNFPFLQLELLQLQGETDDINSSVNPSSRIADYTALGGWRETMRVMMKKAKCSALVKPTEDGKEIWFAHTTW
jgi:hypothetical protein